MEAGGRGRQRWSVSGLASLGAHGALMTGCLWWSIHHPSPRSPQQPTEVEIRSVPPVVASGAAARTTAVPTRGRARPARGMYRSVAARIPVSRDDEWLPAPPSGWPEGDEDQSFDDPAPSTLAEAGEPGGGPPGPEEAVIAPLEAAYLCTYQSLRALPRSLYKRGKAYRLLVQMCISAEGRVENVTLEQSAAPELDAQVMADMREWRYRPRIVEGKPSAFCYKVRVSYEVD
jgi:TonB family protein